jgi:hypothetical protein
MAMERGVKVVRCDSFVGRYSTPPPQLIPLYIPLWIARYISPFVSIDVKNGMTKTPSAHTTHPQSHHSSPLLCSATTLSPPPPLRHSNPAILGRRVITKIK